MKLHYYEDALSCTEYQLLQLNYILEDYKQTLKRLKTNKLSDLDRIFLKKDPVYFSKVSIWIAKKELEIEQYEQIKTYLLKNDTSALDRIIANTEIKSRVHLKRLLGN